MGRGDTELRKSGAPFAVEVHRSTRRALLNAAFLLAPVGVLVFIPDTFARVLAWAGLAVGLWAVALFARGFTYRFSEAGVEVVALVRRAMFIGRDEIVEAERRECDPLRAFGGWGLRGTGSNRAFVVGGKTGIVIRTRSGQVFLGHDRPERLLAHVERLRA